MSGIDAEMLAPRTHRGSSYLPPPLQAEIIPLSRCANRMIRTLMNLEESGPLATRGINWLMRKWRSLERVMRAFGIVRT